MATGLGNRICERRKELGISQGELAARVGLKSKSTICKIERGEDNLTTDSIKRYAVALSVTPAYLMGWEDIDGNPIEQPRVDYRIPISAYRPDFVKSAIEVYQQIQRLSPENQEQLKSYLEYLLTRS